MVSKFEAWACMFITFAVIAFCAWRGMVKYGRPIEYKDLEGGDG